MIKEVEERVVLAPITWEAIEQEAGNYKQAFVSLFRKYEGRPIVDENGQAVTVATGKNLKVRRQAVVSRHSFGERFGIPESTLRTWEDQLNGRARFAQTVSQRLPSNLDGLVDVIGRASEKLLATPDEDGNYYDKPDVIRFVRDKLGASPEAKPSAEPRLPLVTRYTGREVWQMVSKAEKPETDEERQQWTNIVSYITNFILNGGEVR